MVIERAPQDPQIDVREVLWNNREEGQATVMIFHHVKAIRRAKKAHAIWSENSENFIHHLLRVGDVFVHLSARSNVERSALKRKL